MKKFLNLILSLALIMTFTCKISEISAQNKVHLETTQDTISYLIGNDVGNNFKKNQIELNLDAFSKGLESAMKGNDSLIPKARKDAIMSKFQQELQAKQQTKMTQESETNKAAGKAFLDENRKKPGVKETPSGLQYKVIQAGTGKSPVATSKVTVNYEGKLINGKKFDSSYDRGQTASFPLNGVIKGWTEGLQLMQEGSTFEFYIPSDLGYGDRGNQSIPGGSTLIFKVELIKVE